MIGFANLHILSIKHGEIYVHHFWLLAFILYMCASGARSYHTCRKDKTGK